MNTFLNYLAVVVLFALVLLPSVLGLARERRIDRELRDAASRREGLPPGTPGAARPVTVTRRPYLRSWVRV